MSPLQCIVTVAVFAPFNRGTYAFEMNAHY